MSTNIAYDFIDAGYRIFGLYGVGPDGNCACRREGCEAAFKHPIASNWQHTPNWSEEQLEGMQEMGQLDTGYGVVVKGVGEDGYGLLVVDVDARNGGVASYVKLIERLGVDLAAESGLTVSTGSGQGSMHIYYKAPEGVAMMQSHPDFPGVDFKSSGFTVGPGSMHKSGNTYEILYGSPDQITDAPACLVDLLKRPERFRAEYNGSTMDVSEADLADMLRHVSPDVDHETWYRLGMAVHHATGGTGMAVWDNWSAGGAKYPGQHTIAQRWHSFGKGGNPVTMGTLVYHAQQGGWEESVEFNPTSWFDEDGTKPVNEANEPVEVQADSPVPATVKKSSRPFHTKGIDLLRPPGLVGEVCKWINDQSLFPRENLAVAASLVAMSNVIGLRYTDDVSGVTANLFAMCVAGSATGKEAVMQSIMQIHQAAGINRATVGNIKSDQEIIRNLTDNQAAFYIIDEFGIELKKITQSKEAYHQGVVGTLMAIYSKANGFYPMTGDSKRDVKNRLMGELKNCRKAVSENEDQDGRCVRRIPKLERAVKSIDNGLEKPYLSLIGFTTPVTFDGLVTPEQARNGFIGRSILVTEKETNPRMKPDFKQKPMGDRLKMQICGLYQAGFYDQDVDRVEFYEERSKIPTDSEAREMLKQVGEWAYHQAEIRKETGLEAIPRRAYEMVCKISLILSANSGLRTAEHVRWAFAFIERDINEKCNLALANEMDTDQPGSDSGLAIWLKITNTLADGHVETRGVVVNRCKKWSKENVDKILDAAIASGKVVSEETINPHNGRTVVRLSIPLKDS